MKIVNFCVGSAILFSACIKAPSHSDKNDVKYSATSSVKTHVDEGIPEGSLPENNPATNENSSESFQMNLSQPKVENSPNDCQPGFYRDPETDICVEDIDPSELKF